MATTTLSPSPVQKFFDNNGIPLAFGKLFTYQAGTSTKLATYTDSTGGTPNANPIILNARGEANVWIPPNVAYKFVLANSTDTDPPANPIWSVDQIINSQLITLYGGVDSGIANAYVLTFTANFTAYTDGVVVIWIPTHTNTGASTININGLGVINIVNADLSALSAGQLTANAPAQILIKGGQAILQNPFSTFQSGSFTVTYVGGTTAPTGTCNWTRSGNQVTLLIPNLGATSNSTSFSYSGLPASLQPQGAGSQYQVAIPYAVDNGANVTGIGAQFTQFSGFITFTKAGVVAGWTAAGTKAIAFPTALTYYLI
jgi:hypothetical protein